MDSRITKKRLQVTLAYDWVKMITIIALICFAWVLAYTIGAPRASVGQTFGLFVYRDFSCAKAPNEVLATMQGDGVFSYDILDFNSRELDSETYATVISTVVHASEGDVMIISDFADQAEKNSSKMRDFVDNYAPILFDFESIVKNAKTYCTGNRFVCQSTDGEYFIDESEVCKYFASRMKKDPRFRDKSSEKYKQGERDEIARIKAIWNNALKLEYYLNTYPELGVKYHRFTQYLAKAPDDQEGKAVYESESEKIWAINLGALTGGEKQITDLYARNITDEEGNITEITANGITVCLFNYVDQPDHAYEGIQFINYLIEEYSNFANNLQIANLID